jgi:hypothetical protein
MSATEPNTESPQDSWQCFRFNVGIVSSDHYLLHACPSERGHQKLGSHGSG